MKVPFCELLNCYDFIHNLSQALSKYLSKRIVKVDKWDYSKKPLQELRISFCLGFLWIPRKTGRQNCIGEAPFFKVQLGIITGKNFGGDNLPYLIETGLTYLPSRWALDHPTPIHSVGHIKATCSGYVSADLTDWYYASDFLISDMTHSNFLVS